MSEWINPHYNWLGRSALNLVFRFGLTLGRFNTVLDKHLRAEHYHHLSFQKFSYE